MARHELTPLQEKLIKEAFRDVPRRVGPNRRRPRGSIQQIVITLQSKGVNLCEDTIRKHAVRLGLIELKGAKYLSTLPSDQWSRPCMNCGDKKPRPKNIYICSSCARKTNAYW